MISADGTGTHDPAFTGKVDVQTAIDISADLIAVDGKVYAELPIVGWQEIDPADYEVLPPGVDIHAYAALLTLAGGATRSQQSIATTIDVSRTTMVKVAAELADQGLVERVRNPEDRRSYALTRTPEGAAAARRWRRHAEDLEEALTPGFSLAEREELRRLLLEDPWGSDSLPTPPSPCWRAWASSSPVCTCGCIARSRRCSRHWASCRPTSAC